ncbi:MAG: efflux RND transporter permease subunit [Bacteroidales bacterium]|nr:efflux RND transporter permease subunit [Bacteroidales bacterium]
MENKKETRDFGLTTVSIKNRNTVVLLTIVLAFYGLFTYVNLPKESFPDIKIPNVFIKTIYPGNPPVDIENLITRPLEKEIKTIKGVKEFSSTSSQDNSDIVVEFKSDYDIKKALQDVKDAIDAAKSEMPDDLDIDPIVKELDASEFPVLSINLSGDFSMEELRIISDDIKDEIEAVPQISKVELKGLNDRQINIDIDKSKMKANNVSFKSIEDAISFENKSISGGDLVTNYTRRSVRVDGEFKTIEEMNDIVVKHEKGNIVYLRDIIDGGKVKDGYVDPLTYARLNRHNVVSLSVVKKSGENLITATENIKELLRHSRKTGLIPENMHIEITNDMSDQVKNQVNNLENSIIMGMLFVIIVLFFFLGLRNSLFVGFAIPMSMLISFVIIGMLGYTINMMTLFGLVLALGMLVDNAIVVVENIYRFIDKGCNTFEATRQAVGEIAWPIIASTATTLAAFLPLIFWPGMMGSFMGLLPITLIIVLSSSLFVALVIVPTFVVILLNDGNKDGKMELNKMFKLLAIMIVIGGIGFFGNIMWFANLTMFMAILMVANYLFLYSWSEKFQAKFLVWLENYYLKVLNWALKGNNPRYLLGGGFILLIATFIFFGNSGSKVLFFPENEPRYLNITMKLPIGTDIDSTNLFADYIDKKVNRIIEKDSAILKSVLTIVGRGAIGEHEQAFGNSPEKALITITFIDFDLRGNHRPSADIMKELSDSLIGHYAGVQISVEKNKMGPPTGKPINLEVQGVEYNKLIQYTDSVMAFLENIAVPGVEGLKRDLDNGKPELIVHINRDKARRFGLSTAQIAMAIRTSLFGKEISDFKDGEDKYPIRLRYSKEYRNDIGALMNQSITFRNNQGKLLDVPISAVAEIQYSNTYGSVNRRDMKRVITIYSNILEGYNANDINAQLRKLLSNFKLPEGYIISFTGEQEDQAEAQAFLSEALVIALALIFLILVTQFNSFAKPIIIMISVLFSTIGVFGGLATFTMDFVVIMTGIGIISLAGIVVNNAIVLIDYIDLLKDNRREELGLAKEDNLEIQDSIDCVIAAGKTRLRPVLLTAITTVLGLLPMAVGLNINFGELLTNLAPDIYFGGENADFWGPMAWTVIFGLSFATFLTLILVPVMYVIGNKIKLYFVNK